MSQQDQIPQDDESNEASHNLLTEAGEEDAGMLGAEEDGPTKAPDANGGAYVIP